VHSDYPTNDMPNRLKFSNDDFALTGPTGGWTYKRNVAFYANMVIKCDNKFAQVTKTEAFAVACTALTNTINDVNPTTYLDGTAFNVV
jgi:hypothetical protein